MSESLPGADLMVGDHLNWDLDRLCPGFSGDRAQAGVATTVREFARIAEGLRARTGDEEPDLDAVTALLVDLERADALRTDFWMLVYCVESDDSGDPKLARLHPLRDELDDARAAAVDVSGRLLEVLSPDHFRALIDHPDLSHTGGFLRELREAWRHRMTEAEESLASELGHDGIDAWKRLYTQIAADLSFLMPAEADDDRRAPTQQVPMSQQYSLLSHHDPAIRRSAFERGNRAWKSVEIPVAACLNAISGSRLTLWRRRGYRDFADAVADEHRVQRSTIDTMLDVIFENRGLGQEYLITKARLSGVTRLGIYDRYHSLAPVDAVDAAPIPLAEALDLILESFETHHPPLAHFARRECATGGVETEVRPGKAALGFQAEFPASATTAVSVTYGGTFNDVAMVAHELGHAYHAHVLQRGRYWASRPSSALCESVALAAEGFVRHHVLDRDSSDTATRIHILSALMNAAVNYTLRIPRDHEFEMALYAGRSRSEYSVAELTSLMAGRYRHWFGDALAGDSDASNEMRPDGLDEMHWASGRYFYFERPFANVGYMLGFLIGRAIAARARRQGPAFGETFERFLELSGRLTTEEAVRAAWDLDLRDHEFWQSAFDDLRESLDEFETVANRRFGP